MAMRENTGLQVALILFVMITVVLAVTTYIYFDSAKDSQAAEDKAKADADNLRASVTKLNDEIRELRSMMGYKVTADGGPVVSEIAKRYHSDMAQFGKGYTSSEEYDQFMKAYEAKYGDPRAGEEPAIASTRNYRTLPQYLSGRNLTLSDELSAAKHNVTDLSAQLAQAQQMSAKNLAARDAEYAEAVKDYNTQKTTIASARDELVSRVNNIQKEFDITSREVSSIKATKDKEIDALTQRVTKLDLLRKTLTDKIDNIQNPASVGAAEKPDGRVTWVSQRGGTVYINLGSDDGLRRSTMFTVYDAGVVNLGQTDPKASIEVTTIRGPHLAEARIVEDSLSDPILSQDAVYSPVWNPGQKTHFALVGFMDVDNDRKSDRNLIRSLISQNGGAIDAEVLDDGSREGKLTINTRYLVVGERATDKSSEAARTAYSQMIGEASDLGIETISVERLLSDMGWRGNERTVGAGSDPSGGTFKAVPKETRDGDDGFQPRTRPGIGTRRNSAY